MIEDQVWNGRKLSKFRVIFCRSTKEAWEEVLGPIPSYGHICHKHFRSNQVYLTKRNGGKYQLRRGEVPTLCLPTKMEVNDAIILKKMRKEEKEEFFRAVSDDLDSDNDEECISGMATNTILLFHGHLHD